VRALIAQQVDVNTPQADGATALAWAAHREDLEIAELLIRAGANVNAANDYGVTPLALASANGSAAMVEKLLNAGADPNAALPTGETVLMTASRTGSLAVVQSLLAHGSEANAMESWRGQTALMWAVDQKHPQVVQALVQHGADVHARSSSGFTPLLFAARVGDIDSARILLAAGANADVVTPRPEDGGADKDRSRGFDGGGKPYSYRGAPYGMSPLLMAAASGHESLSIFLLDHGADPNVADSNGTTALHYAVLQGMVAIASISNHLAVNSYLFRPDMLELTKALLARGADPNARLTKDPLLPGGLPRVSMAGATPFLLATAACDVTLLRVLMEGHADVQIPTKKGTTPLMIAAGLGRYEDRTEEEERSALEAVQLLVSLGADVNAVGENGYTALHGAAYVGADSIVRFLVEQGARIETLDNFGQTPLSIAEGVITTGIVEFSKKPWGTHRTTSNLLLELGALPLASSGVKVLDVLKDGAAENSSNQ
jgi:ankyrin repeat protein